MRLINGHWGWGFFCIGHLSFGVRTLNVTSMASSSSFADSSSTPPSATSSKFKVDSLTTQIMLAKSNITAAFEDELAAQQKLSKQQAAAEKVSEKVQSSLSCHHHHHHRSDRDENIDTKEREHPRPSKIYIEI